MITRRDLLKGAIAGAATALLPGRHAWARPAGEPIPPQAQGEDSWQQFGRAIHTVYVYQEADTASERVRTYARDEAIPILGETRAPFSAHNDLWYQTDEGYVHSAWVLPVRLYPLQPFIEDVGTWGIWGEISQLYTEGRTAPSPNAPRRYRFYASTVFHVTEAVRDEEGNGWYRVEDDYPPYSAGNHQWVLAQDVRRIPRAEMAPIHPFVGDKRIEVDLTAQSLTCFEGETVAFTTLVASGSTFPTTTGLQHVLLKQASRHMANVPYPEMKEENRPSAADIFDLPGVPWNTFFNLEGQAIHGAYWHNDFGIRRSHGCLNVAVDAAHWIYRWVHPIGGYQDEFIRSDARVGTPILIF